MKKTVLYIVLALAAGATLFYFFGMGRQKKKINTFISLNKKDKNPYGSYVFYENLQRFFPGSTLTVNYSDPGDNEIFGENETEQLYVILNANFQPDRYEVDDLITFIERGNNVFISTFNINEELSRFIGSTSTSENFFYFPWGEKADEDLAVSLKLSLFGDNFKFRYPGAAIEGYFETTDSLITDTLGYTELGRPNFIRLKKGEGFLYLHLSPMTLTNYFLLYGKNIQYFEKIFSLIPASTPHIIWDEYFNSLTKRENNSNWLSAILKNSYFRAGILTALLFLLVFTLTEMRRKQRVIPVIKEPINDSLDFVKTIGLLYYERGDHHDLAQKLSAYFMEHVRSRYKIFSKEPDLSFVRELSYKSGVSASLVSAIIEQVNRISNENTYSDTELIAFQNNIEEFYNQE